MADGSLYRTVYHSRNTMGDEAGSVIGEIMDASSRNNVAAGVTGALLFSQDLFAQVLEGPRDAVIATFNRIARDPRHSDVVVVTADAVAERVFGDWSMAFVSADRTLHPLILSRLNAAGDTSISAAWLIKLLQGFVSDASGKDGDGAASGLSMMAPHPRAG